MFPSLDILSSTEPSEFINVDLEGVDEERELDGRRSRWVPRKKENDQKRMVAARELASSTMMDIEEASTGPPRPLE